MTETSGDVDEVRAERDALRRELGVLRAHLCVALGILRREPGPEGLEVLEVVSDREILAAVRKLSVDAAPTTVGVDDRWSAVDRLIDFGKVFRNHLGKMSWAQGWAVGVRGQWGGGRFRQGVLDPPLNG